MWQATFTFYKSALPCVGRRVETSRLLVQGVHLMTEHNIHEILTQIRR